MTGRDQLWQHLAASLSTLVDLLAPKLDEENLSLLRDFVDNREYGVALEWLVSLIKTHSIPISSEQLRWDSAWTASLLMGEIVVDAVSVNAGKVMMGGHERRRG